MRAWVQGKDPWQLAAKLQAAGVPAYVVLRPSDLYEDAQLTHRGFFVTLNHTEMGPTPYDGAVTLGSDSLGQPRFAAPCLGEHTQKVLREFLGLSEDEVTDLAIAGVLT
jgi:crotonobetainyl-CoA:carnitine CoA-transferase CaiB-like acyl-CoA transferase